jgi:hypothetical protein
MEIVSRILCKYLRPIMCNYSLYYTKYIVYVSFFFLFSILFYSQNLSINIFDISIYPFTFKIIFKPIFIFSYHKRSFIYDRYPDWYEDKIAIRLWKKKQRNTKSNSTFTGIVIVYKNMSRFIPTAYIKELE